MDQARANRPDFRLPLGPSPRQRLRIGGGGTAADFLSQVIAGRQEVPQPAEQSHTAIEAAVTAYDNGARIAVRRMPAGYRKTIVT